METQSPKIIKLLHKGVALHRQGKLGDAKQIYEKILQKQSNNFDALQLLGSIYNQIKLPEMSLKYFDKALKINKTNPAVYNNRGNAFQALKRFGDALKSYEEALKLNPDYAEAYNNLGNTLQELGRFEDALKSYDLALRIRPDYADAFYDRGNAFQALKRFGDALKSYEEALKLNPDYAEAYNNLGKTLQELGRFEDALKSYEEALKLNPDYTEATWNKSLLLILIGDYLEGWTLYESRLEKEDTKKDYPSYPQVAWRGQENIQGKKILISSEQGLGDTIQFVRYLEKIHQVGAEIVLQVPKTLSNITSTIRAPITVIDNKSKLPEFDAYCPLLSLPHVFKTTVETIPASVPYLSADQQKVSEWDQELGVKTITRIGLAWSGAGGHKNDHNRSIPLELLTNLIDLPVEWHSLQKEYRAEDKKVLESITALKQHQDHLEDFTDTAALIECMDLVISVDTSVAHLAGALGKPIWILLPFVPDYRWMLEREDCPWYPTAKLLRQDETRDWRKVINRVVSSLRSMN
jgi:tetratricopeptide (TPR) repeat protein